MSAPTHAVARPQKAEVRPVSQPQDRHEREAERAAAEVARGGTVSGWSFSAVPAAAAPVQRQDSAKPAAPKSNEDKEKDALLKAGEAALKTKAGKALTDRVLADPGVKKLKDFATSPAGIAVESTLAAGGIVALGAAHKPLPFQPPAIPLDKITPGLSAQITYQGPVDKPTFVGLTVTFKEQGPKGKKGPSDSERYAAETARIAAANREFQSHVTYAPGSKEAEDERMFQDALMKVTGLGGLPGFTVPLTPPSKTEEQKAPVQRAPATETAAPQVAHVDDALAGDGRPLDPATRRTMEARFGRDFSEVRIHDDAHAAATAASIDAAAFTVGADVAFAAGRYAPSTAAGRELLAHELTHVLQQDGGRHAYGRRGPVQRKVVVAGSEYPRREFAHFLRRHRWPNRTLARSVLEDMATANDVFDFTDENELVTEVIKRVETVDLMAESQRVVGHLGRAFGYPFTRPAILYGPRVNYAAREYWQPRPPDDYAARTDRAKNHDLIHRSRSQRYAVYGDMSGDYSWTLTDRGRRDPYAAITRLFAPHRLARLRSLLHCDYLVSIVNFRSLAETIGRTEFNSRIAAFGADRVVLRWNAFSDLHRIAYRTLASIPHRTVSIPGLDSTQRMRPNSEADLVIGDHVVFHNHLAYDLINAKIGNSWRLENAILIGRPRDHDVFLGHGSGRKSERQMREKLAEEYNKVAEQAITLTRRVASTNRSTASRARAEIHEKFDPALRERADGWYVVGTPTNFCATARVDARLRRIRPDEVIGLRDPCDRTRMYPVERPIESARGRP